MSDLVVPVIGRKVLKYVGLEHQQSKTLMGQDTTDV